MTRRPVLAPGLTIRQRTSDELQIGLSDRHRLRIADTAAVRRTLADLGRGEALRHDQETRNALRLLAPALRDGDTLLRPGIPASEVAAITLLHPTSAPARLQARLSSRIAVVGSFDDTGAEWFLTRSGLTASEPDDRPTAALVLSTGALARTTSDALVRTGVPHLIVEAVESDIVVGPFVVPGQTACLRCLDAHRTAADPLHPVLVGTDPQITRHDGVTAPLHAALVTMALSWAVADLVRYVEGDRPTTWSATVTLAPDRTAPAPASWPRHPACGCSWAGTDEPTSAQEPSATMGP